METGPKVGGVDVRTAGWADLDSATAYALLKLRSDVFVVEQNCVYPEMDGRDLESSARHLWTADGAGPTSYLRLLQDAPGEARIGRVCTRADARGAGLAARLVDAALALVPGQVVRLNSQQYLGGWYARWGFETSGEPFLDDGIPHVPMTLTP